MITIEIILGFIFIVIGLFMAILSFSRNIREFSQILLLIAGFCLLWHGSSIIHDESAELNKNTAISTQLPEPEFNGR